MRRRWTAVLLATMITLLTGCSDFADRDQLSMAPEAGMTLEAGHSIGQTFVAHHGGLNAVEVYLSPASDDQGTIALHLRDSPISTTDILTASISISAGSQEGFYRFYFPPILHSHTRYYYVFLEHEGAGQVKVQTGGLDSYLDGVLYYNHEPRESQAVFRLSYNPLLVTLDLLLMAAGWIGYGVAGLTILFFSGYWIVRTWTRQRGVDFTPVLVLSTVSALAAWMVFLVWASVFSIHLEASSVRLVVGLNALVGLIYFLKDKEQWRRREYWLGENPLRTLTLWIVIVLSIALRLFVGRGTVMLPGSDSYHHTLIAQLFMEQGGIPHSYEPYAQLISFSYHCGFHSVVALFRWLFGTELLVTTKNLALVLNGAIAATVGLLSEQVAGNRRAGVIAAALVGLIMVSPFCLLRWSRFTQATGLLFLAVGLLVLSAGRERTCWALLSLSAAGMVLSHYRIAFFWGLFVVIGGGMKILQRRWDEVKGWLVIGMISVALTAPWLLRVVWIQHDPYGLRITYPILGGYNNVKRLEEPILSFISNGPVVVSAVLFAGVAWLGKKSKAMQQALIAWCFVLVIGALIFPLTGFYFWDLKTSLLSLPVPLAVLAGLAGEVLWNTLRGGGRLVIRGVLVVALLLGMGIGVFYLPHLVYTAPLYLRPGNLVTMKWIEDNIPKDAFLVVNGGQCEWSPGWIVGIDTGYWIPLLAHRETTLPPMIYSWEWGSSSRLLTKLGASHELLLRRDGEALSIGEVLGKYGVTHVFTDAQHWPLMPRELSQDAHLREIYRQDRVWVFEVAQ
jgi:hypothetical protein